METSTARSRFGIPALIGAAALLLVAAIAVRSIAPARVVLPEDVRSEEPRIAEPMQFVARGAALRVAELDRWVTPGRRPLFSSARGLLFHLEGCPELLDWINGVDGQPIERLLVELRTGTREDALAALALLFQITRATEWKPGLRARAERAERLGGLLQDWLRVWGQRGVKDPVLAEPTLAAAVLYGRVMRTAWRAPVIGFNRAPYDRSQAFLRELTGAMTQRTEFGEALQARHPRAFSKLLAGDDVLAGLEEEAAALFPELVGDCSR